MAGTLKVQAVGMAWYHRDEYQRLRKEMADGHVLHDTYDGWLKAAEQGVTRMTQSGVRVVKADLKLDDFLAWCASLNIRADAEARMRWSNEAAVRVLRSEGPQ